jgi:hypothetical protein
MNADAAANMARHATPYALTKFGDAEFVTVQ